MALTPPNNSPSNLDSNGKPLPPCHPNPKGWEIGVYKLTLTDAGKDWIERSKVDEEHARENGYNWDKGEGVLKLEGDVVEDSEVLEEDTIRRNTIVSVGRENWRRGRPKDCGTRDLRGVR